MKTKERKRKKSCEINLLCRAFTRATDNWHAQTKARTWRSCLGVIDEESKGVRSVLCKLAQAGPISTSNERPGTHMGERESERERAYAWHEGCDRLWALQPCHLSSYRTTLDSSLPRLPVQTCQGGWTKTDRWDVCLKERAFMADRKIRVGGQFEGIQYFWLTSVWDISRLTDPISYRSKCIQLHFPPALYLPPGNTVISVRVVKTAIKSLSVWFPVTLYRLTEGRLNCCVNRRSVFRVCLSVGNVMDRSKLKVLR